MITHLISLSNIIITFLRFKVANGGVPFDPPKVEVPKKEPSAPVEKGPSKKCRECSFDLFIYFNFFKNFELIINQY
jgi:hypothetical protein